MLDLDFVAQIGETPEETAAGSGPITMVEKRGVEIMVGDAITSHVVAGREHVGCDGQNGLLGAATRSEPTELSDHRRGAALFYTAASSCRKSTEVFG